MTDNLILDLVTQHLPLKRKKSSSGFYICCPMCTQMGESRNDTKFRGGFTPKADGSFLYHCYNCGYATGHQPNGRVGKNLMKFLVALGIPSEQIPISLRLLRSSEKLDKQIKPKTLDVAIDFDSVKLPPGSKPIEEWAQNDPPLEYMKSIEYLYGRGDSVFNGWQYYWTDDNKFSMNQRIIIPFFHHSKIIGYTARRNHDQETKISKYYGHTPNDYMFNQDKLENDDPYIFLVEGIFDAIAIKGVAVLGNSLTDRQINLLKHSKKQIILIPDRNKAGEHLLEQSLDNDWYVSIPEWDSYIDDVASATKKYGRLYVLENILNTKTKNPMAVRIKFGMSRI